MDRHQPKDTINLHLLLLLLLVGMLSHLAMARATVLSQVELVGMGSILQRQHNLLLRPMQTNLFHLRVM